MNLQQVKQRFGIIGRSAKLDQALDTAVRVASTDLSVLITGESGVGKEVFSKIIHGLSARKHNNFIAVNCGAIPSGTINSELFGHEKGAFTGATGERKGYFETVDGGTIFLDEIGEMPLDTQAFLLRVLESGEFLRVGSSKVQSTDVRVIAATNVDLRDKIKKGRFREDLYYRLNTVPIQVPPLRERRDDVYMLFRKFAVDFAEKYRTTPIHLDERAQLLLESYAWPGNIRELKNVAEQISVLAREKTLDAHALVDLMPHLATRHLPAALPDGGASGGEGLQEREILYKLLFDMKKDLNDLKSLVFELIKNNDLRVPNVTQLRQLDQGRYDDSNTLDRLDHFVHDDGEDSEPLKLPAAPSSPPVSSPIIIGPDEHRRYERMEVVEENLSLEEMEKDMIEKALRKHKGRRKEAAVELGISERTLYRKIRQYDIEN